MAKKSSSSHTDTLVFIAVAASLVAGYFVYRHYEKNVAATKRRVNTAANVPDARGSSMQTANMDALYGPAAPV
jgi:hypothetical protein